MATPSTSDIVLDNASRPAPQFFDNNVGAYSYLYGREGGAASVPLAPVLSGNTGTIASTNTNTSFTISLGNLFVGTASVFDARTAQVIVFNSGTSQTITGLTLTLSGSLGTATPTQTYTPTTAPNIANNAIGSAVMDINGLLLPNVSLTVTFGAAPTAGTVYAQATFQGAGGVHTELAGRYAETLLINQTSLAAGASYPTAANIGTTATLVFAKRVYAVAISLRVTYGGAITASPTVNVYGAWADPNVAGGALQWDTDPYAQGPSPSYAASTTKQKSSLVDVSALAAICVQVVNNDTTNALGQVYLAAQEIDG